MSDQKRRPRVLPHNLDAEASVLGGVLLRQEVLALVPNLEADAFYDPRHRFVFTAYRQLEARSKPIDVTMVESELQAMGKLEAVGGVGFLGELALRCPTPDNVVHYSEIVIRHYRWRRLMERCSETIERGYEGYTDEDPVMEAAEIAADAARGMPIEHMTLGDAIGDELVRVNDLIKRRQAGEDVYACLPSGFRDLDYNLGGAPFGQVTLLLGLRAGAKTTTMQEWAENATALVAKMKSGPMKRGVVAYAYAEDQPPFFAQRAIAGDSVGRIHTEQIGRLTLNPDTLQLFNAHGERKKKSPEAQLILIPCAGMDGEKLARVLQRLHSEHGLAGFFVDYLQRMRAPRGITSRPDAIALNCNALGDIAQQTGAAAILAAQLKPEIDDRDWKSEGGPIPRLGDTRYSQDPEMDARLILAVFDRWKYGIRTLNEYVRYDPQPGHDKEILKRNVVELHCLKRNQGDAELMIMLEWLRESHALRDLPRVDQGRQQMDLGRAAEDEEAWRIRMNEADARGVLHR